MKTIKDSELLDAIKKILAKDHNVEIKNSKDGGYTVLDVSKKKFDIEP